MDSISSSDIAPFDCDDYRRARLQIGAKLAETFDRVSRLATFGDQATSEGADQSENVPAT